MASTKKSGGGSRGGSSSKGRAGGGGGRGGSSGGRSGGSSRGGSSAKKGSSARGGSSAKKSGGSSAKKSSGGSRGGAKSATKRTPNPAFMKPMRPSAQLAAVVGENPAPRTEITKKLWEYIKRKGLQDPQQKRMINADENLRPIFKKDQVSMFDMTKLVNKHLSEG